MEEYGILEMFRCSRNAGGSLMEHTPGGMFFKNFPRVKVIFDHTFISSILDDKSIVIDLGANIGGFTVPLVNEFQCEVFLCEPIPDVYNRIPENPRIHKYPYCISSATGQTTLVLPDDNCASVYYEDGRKNSTTITVEGITYRDFLRTIGVRNVNLLKLDIEGAEIDLFKSLSDDEIRAHQQLAVEFHDFIFQDLRDEFISIEKRIIGCGFYMIPFSVGRIDVLFVRKDAITHAGYFYLMYCVKNYFKIIDILTRLKRKIKKTILSRR
jgi:FkbM family methyltransferase